LLPRMPAIIRDRVAVLTISTIGKAPVFLTGTWY
jgi:hypothetical protein